MVIGYARIGLVGAMLLGGAGGAAMGQQGVGDPALDACGAAGVKFKVRSDQGAPTTGAIPAGTARVYIVETMASYSLATTRVNVGMDGKWLGATVRQTHLALVVAPGLHHLCAEYQGEAAGMDPEGRRILLRLNAEAGKTYYITYHASLRSGRGGSPDSLAFFDFVNEDEGRYLVQLTPLATSRR